MIHKLSQFETEIIQLKEECKLIEIREHNLHLVIATFTNSSKIMEKIVNVQKPSKNKAGLGFNFNSQSHSIYLDQT